MGLRGIVRGLIAALALALAACAPGQGPGGAPGASRAADPGWCEAVFRDYDRLYRLSPSGAYSIGADDRPILRPGFSRLNQRALQGGCITFPSALGNLDALRAAALRDRPADVSPAVEPVLVHAGVVTSFVDEVSVLQFYRALGYNARTLGMDGLGRRVFVGPLGTEGQVAEVIGLSRRAGFVAPYVPSLPSL
jgi:hypothetical protein